MRSFRDALPADTLRCLRNLQRRRRYQQNLDRPKVWPGNAIPHDLAAFWWRNPDEARQLLRAARGNRRHGDLRRRLVPAKPSLRR